VLRHNDRGAWLRTLPGVVARRKIRIQLDAGAQAAFNLRLFHSFITPLMEIARSSNVPGNFANQAALPVHTSCALRQYVAREIPESPWFRGPEHYSDLREDLRKKRTRISALSL